MRPAPPLGPGLPSGGLSRAAGAGGADYDQKHLLLLLVGPALGRPVSPAAVQLAHLRCELLTNPEGIDATAPRLSWELSSPARGLEQTTY